MPITKAREAGVTIGEVSRRTGVRIETIRYYERAGVVPRASRSENRQRVYGEIEIQRIAFVRRARELGFSLEEIVELAQLAEWDAAACEAVQQITFRHIEDIRGKIRDLRRMAKALSDLLEQCSQGGYRACPVVESLSGRSV